MKRQRTLGVPALLVLAVVSCAGFREPGRAAAQAVPSTMWTRLSGSPAADYGFAVAVDGTGDVYITGTTFGDLGGQGNAGRSDVLVSKYSLAGQYQWARLLGTAADEQGYGVAADGLGNVYITGGTYGNLGGQTGSGLKDAFLAKYTTQGVYQWTRLLGTSADDVSYGVATDGVGSVYVTGSTGGALGGKTNAGGTDAFVARYDAAGVNQWTTLLGSTAFEAGYAVAADRSGALYIAGQTFGDLGGQTKVGGGDAFLSRLDSSGMHQWTRVLGTKLYESGNGVAVDGSGNAYITGYTEGKLDGQATENSPRAFLSKYDLAGVLQWTKLLGAATYASSYSVAVDDTGNAYITGHTRDDFGGQVNIGGDAFLAKYDPAGALLWVRLLGSDGYDSARGVFVDPGAPGGKAHIVGWTGGSMGGWPGAGDFDVFLAQVAEAIGGDANLDGIVDLQDFGTFKINFGESPRDWNQGDFNGDGLVDLQDFGILKEHFGESLGAPGTPVPEPSSVAVLLFGMCAAARRRR